jgi:hypothetical protein
LKVAAKDYVQAYKWFYLASALSAPPNNPEFDQAANNRGHVAAKLTQDQIAEAKQLAREWMAAFEKRKKK